MILYQDIFEGILEETEILNNEDYRGHKVTTILYVRWIYAYVEQ